MADIIIIWYRGGSARRWCSETVVTHAHPTAKLHSQGLWLMAVWRCRMRQMGVKGFADVGSFWRAVRVRAATYELKSSYYVIVTWLNDESPRQTSDPILLRVECHLHKGDGWDRDEVAYMMKSRGPRTLRNAT